METVVEIDIGESCDKGVDRLTSASCDSRGYVIYRLTILSIRYVIARVT